MSVQSQKSYLFYWQHEQTTMVPMVEKKNKLDKDSCTKKQEQVCYKSLQTNRNIVT